MKKRILTVVGARPQIIKAAALSRAIRENFSDQLEEVIVHTGQHYDQNMSAVFFTEMQIPLPAHNLQTGSGTHAEQTAAMMTGLEACIAEEKPDAVLVYGDTNSTLAAALTASKLHLPVIHIEAGLRSFDKTMPEEINRVLCDHVSALLFAPTDTAVENLMREGFPIDTGGRCDMNHPAVVKSGDVMYDNALYYAQHAHLPASAEGGPFLLATIHRDHNTDHPQRLRALTEAVSDAARTFGLRVILPLHPRTRARMNDLSDQGWKMPENIIITEPMSYLQMIALESHAELVITDSGGVQKEAYFFRKPCVILRPHTEWVEIVRNGNALLAGDSPDKVREGVKHFMGKPDLTWPSFFGNGHSAEEMCARILEAI